MTSCCGTNCGCEILMMFCILPPDHACHALNRAASKNVVARSLRACHLCRSHHLVIKSDNRISIEGVNGLLPVTLPLVN
jgi:hypothetical protein